MKKLAIVTTHPIQYNAPIFKLLSKRGNIQIKVFYTWEDAQEGVFDIKFNQRIKWDIPLLDGYDFQFVKNTSTDQGSHHFKGIVNPTLNQEILEWKADAILIFGWNFQSHFKAMRYFKGKIPIYFRGDSTLLNERPGLKTILRRLWLRFVFSYIDCAYYVGINNKKYYLKHGLSEKQLIYAPHAIDNERFYDNEGIYSQKAEQWKKELLINKDDLVFLFAGKFEPIKNPELFVDAANHLKDRHFKFIMAGDGFLKESMMQKASKNTQIIFLPFQNQTLMPILYRLCHVLVVCSNSETWGLAVNEAMACGKAILVSDKTGCAPDLVEDGKNGFVFKTGDLNDFIDKINRIDFEKSINFGTYSKLKIKGFSFDNLANTIESSLNLD